MTTPGLEALREAMRFEQARVYGQLCPEPPTAAQDAAARYVVTPPPAPRRLAAVPSASVRRLIEQRIARGLTEPAIAAELQVEVEQVQIVRQAMDAVA